MILVCIPTIKGRSHWFNQCRDAYLATSPKDVRISCVRDYPSCGTGWNGAVTQAFMHQGGAEVEYLHFTCDDIVPHEGWWREACQVADAGELPAPMLYEPDGSRWNFFDGGPGDSPPFTRLPFMSRAQWDLLGPFPPIHYYSDCYASDVGNAHGMATRIVEGYAFTHHWAQEGRKLEGQDEDVSVYQQWVARLTEVAA